MAKCAPGTKMGMDGKCYKHSAAKKRSVKRRSAKKSAKKRSVKRRSAKKSAK
jgi:hypothetical protein